ncbi:MAG: ABC transporter substrate-binding protein [Bacteroidota bacterium]
MHLETVRLGGVPEYFNYPIHYALERKWFEKEGIALSWVEVPEGTGEMVRLLNEGELDLGIVLTEGIVQSIAKGNSARIIKTYVQSSLIWGVHVHHTSEFHSLDEIKKAQYLISRYGSGSHLMSSLFVSDQGWDIKNQRFQVINNLEGAIKQLSENSRSVFFWEKYTTKPLVDSGELKRIGQYPTPWPCFVIAASVSFSKQSNILGKCIKVINKAVKAVKEDESTTVNIASKYNLDLEDVKELSKATSWDSTKEAPHEAIDLVSRALVNSGILTSPVISGEACLFK